MLFTLPASEIRGFQYSDFSLVARVREALSILGEVQAAEACARTGCVSTAWRCRYGGLHGRRRSACARQQRQKR
eukprot:5625571-Alexandrium_andersonii.AAC.1